MFKSKKVISLLLTIFMMLSLGSIVVFADDTNEDNSSSEQSVSKITPRIAQYVWTTTTDNIRSGPGTNYSIIGTLQPNTRVWITYAEYDAYGVDWYYSSDMQAWICSNYVRYTQ